MVGYVEREKVIGGDVKGAISDLDLRQNTLDSRRPGRAWHSFSG